MTLTLENVTRRVEAETHIYETTVRLTPGSLNILLGSTLAGKTTLMRLMAGLDRPSSGHVLVGERDVTGLSVRRRNVAMVYQQFINYPSVSVYDNIASPLRRARLGREEINRRVREAAALFHIEDLLDRLPSALSGGQQQRTALARALVKDSDLLLLDEPLVNLDYKLREELRSELRSIFRRRDAIVVYATTEPYEALMLGGSVVVMDEGRVLQSGSTVEVYNNPATARVGAIFSDPPMNMIAGVVENGSVRLGRDVRVPLPPHMNGLHAGRYDFGMRANSVCLARQSAGDVAFPATVELTEISGSETFIHVVHDDVSWVAREEGVHGLDIGETIRLYVDPASMFVFDEGGRLVAAPKRGDRRGKNGAHRP
ncbi:MAG: ABC transporter ATP-binding protein [Alphaproteobacteria bacterium]